MAIVGGIMVPHPPLIHPLVGRGGEKQIEKTVSAYEEASAKLMAQKPDTLVIISPHSVMYRDYLHISPGAGASGSLARFGAPSARFEVKYDRELVAGIMDEANLTRLPAGTQGERDASLDHGTMIPLYFLRQAEGWPPPYGIVRIGLSGLPFASHYRLGMCLRDAAHALGRRAGIVASGDLSHYLRPEGPYGYRAEGSIYDKTLMDVMGRAAFDELLGMEEPFCEKAGECGHRSFTVMAGAFDRREVKPEILSYEGVTGVGYGVGVFLPGEETADRAFLAERMN